MGDQAPKYAEAFSEMALAGEPEKAITVKINEMFPTITIEERVRGLEISKELLTAERAWCIAQIEKKKAALRARMIKAVIRSKKKLRL